jgi:hypothetical protein
LKSLRFDPTTDYSHQSFEEDLDLPAGLIYFGNRFGGQVKAVGHEGVDIFALGIMPGNQAQVAGVALT